MPQDLRDWISEGHLVHLILDAVSLLDLSTSHVNHRGTGDARCPPATMLALFVYSYATGTVNFHQIERKRTIEPVFGSIKEAAGFRLVQKRKS